MNAGENLIIGPKGKGVSFVELDDLTAEQLARVSPAVFIIHAISPGNYQASIAVSGLPEGKEAFKEVTRRVFKGIRHEQLLVPITESVCGFVIST